MPANAGIHPVVKKKYLDSPEGMPSASLEFIPGSIRDGNDELSQYRHRSLWHANFKLGSLLQEFMKRVGLPDR